MPHRPRRLLSLALLLASCAPAAPPSPPAASAPSPVPVGSTPDPPLDDAPGVVRCGVDDRPRPIGERPRKAPVERSALRALLAKPAPPDPPLVPPTPVPVVTVTASSARLGGVEAPQLTEGLVGEASPEVCTEQADASDSGPLELTVEMASTGEPFKVRSSRGPAPSPYVRCLMERACRIKTTGGAGGQAVTLPLSLEVGPPALPPSPPPPPPPGPAPAQVRLIGKHGREVEELRAALEALVRSAVAGCQPGAPANGKPLRLQLTVGPSRRSALEPPAPGGAERSLLGAPLAGRARPVGEIMAIESAVVVGKPKAKVDLDEACLASTLGGAFVAFVSPSSARRRVVQIEIRTGP